METRSLIIVEERVLYRYEDNYQYADISYREPVLRRFPIIRETEKSYIVSQFLAVNKRVPKDGKNIYAWDTIEKALLNYIKRKEYHESILNYKLHFVKRNLKFAEQELLKREEYLKENPTSSIIIKMEKAINRIRRKDENSRTGLSDFNTN